MPNVSQKYKKAPYVPFHVKFGRYQRWSRMPPLGMADYPDLKLILQHHGSTLCPCGMFFYFPKEKYNIKSMARKNLLIEQHLREHSRQGYLVWVIAGNASRVREELVYLQAQYPGAQVSAFKDWNPPPLYAGDINIAAMTDFFTNVSATRRFCTARKSTAPFKKRPTRAPVKKSRTKAATRKPSRHITKAAVKPIIKGSPDDMDFDFSAAQYASAEEDELQFLGHVPGSRMPSQSSRRNHYEQRIKQETPSDDEDLLESAHVKAILRSTRLKAAPSSSSSRSPGSSNGSSSMYSSSPLHRKRRRGDDGSSASTGSNNTSVGSSNSRDSGISLRGFNRGMQLHRTVKASSETPAPVDPMVVPLEYSSDPSDDETDNDQDEDESDFDSGYGARRFEMSPEL